MPSALENISIENDATGRLMGMDFHTVTPFTRQLNLSNAILVAR